MSKITADDGTVWEIVPDISFTKSGEAVKSNKGQLYRVDPPYQPDPIQVNGETVHEYGEEIDNE